MNLKILNIRYAIAVMFLIVAAQSGFCFYNPTKGTWVNRDPLNERGGLNLYGFVANNSVNQADPLGLCNIKIRCGPYKLRGVTLGWHCGVVAPGGVEFGIGGAGQSGGLVGTPAIPPVYPDPTKPYPSPGQRAPDQVDYAVSCKCKSCDEVQKAIQNYHDTVTPPHYNALGPNSDTYAHRMLEATGCKVDPISQPPTIGNPSLGIPSYKNLPTTTPPGTVGWNYGF